jgi:antitoxin (DNA-binding transcriptional repressor) of toxin-antitoxin stability system
MTVMNVKPISEVRAKLSQLVDRAFYAQECFVITHHEEARAVLIPIHSERTLALLERLMEEDRAFAAEDQATEEIPLEEIQRRLANKRQR